MTYQALPASTPWSFPHPSAFWNRWQPAGPAMYSKRARSCRPVSVCVVLGENKMPNKPVDVEASQNETGKSDQRLHLEKMRQIETPI